MTYHFSTILDYNRVQIWSNKSYSESYPVVTNLMDSLSFIRDKNVDTSSA